MYRLIIMNRLEIVLDINFRSFLFKLNAHPY